MKAKASKPRILWVANLRCTGGISVITRRFLSDPEVHKRYEIKVQDQSFPDKYEVLAAKIWKVPRGILLILWNLMTFRPALVHIHTAYRSGFLRDGLMALLAKTFGAKVVMTFHSGDGGSLPNNYSQGAKWLKMETDLVLPRTDGLIANGPSYQRFLQERFGHKNVTIMVNPIPDAQVPADFPDYRQRERVVFFAGLLGRRKGVFELLKAAEKVPNARFIIYGRTLTPAEQKDFHTAYQNCQAKDHILLDEGWGVEKVFEYLKQARVLALPSWGESMPQIMEEAIVCGVPVVTTPVGVIADYVKDGVHGFLIDPGDTEALARALNKVLDDVDWAAQVSQTNREYGKIFLQSHEHPRLFSFYDGILEKPG